MAVIMEGRLIVRQRLIKETNQPVDFYSLNTTKGWFQVAFDKKLNLKKLEVPGLVRVEVTSARSKTTTSEDGRTFVNKTIYVTEVEQLEKSPEFEAYEQAKLEEKLG